MDVNKYVCMYVVLKILNGMHTTKIFQQILEGKHIVEFIVLFCNHLKNHSYKNVINS
jgi:hypothetical protein